MQKTVKIPVEKALDYGYWSRWQDQQGRLFIVVGKLDVHSITIKGQEKRQAQKVLLLDVNRELSEIMNRMHFDNMVRMGRYTRVIDEVGFIY